MNLASFPEYVNNEARTPTCHVNPNDVAYVRAWKYHSFREPIAEIGLKCGTKLHVWLPVESVVKRLAETQTYPTREAQGKASEVQGNPPANA